MNTRSMSRREAMQLGAGLLAVGTSASMLGKLAWAAETKRIPISLQLYSVRGDCSKDFEKTLAWVAKTGFAGVEFAGYHKYGGDAAGLRKVLDDLGLKTAGTHIGTSSFNEDQIQKTIEFHQTLGCKFLIVPGDGAFTHPERSKELAEKFNKAAEVLKPHDMYCGYHNHTGEFGSPPGSDTTYWDLFAQRTVKDVVLQQDCGWSAHAGRDPAAYVRKYPGRSKIVHFKPSVHGDAAGKKAYLGQDSVDWPAVTAACYEVGGTEWITIEQEEYPDGKSPMECSEISLKGFQAILAKMGK